MTEPQGIDEQVPRFSWKLKSGLQGDIQTAYRIVVSRTPKNNSDGRAGSVLPPIWDTKTVVSGNSVNIEYTGLPLQPGKSYNWSLIVTDSQGNESDVVRSAFTTGLFPTADEPTPWKGKWIGYENNVASMTAPDITKASWIWDSKSEEEKYPCGTSYFRKTFDLPEEEITSAVSAFAVDNSHKLFVNGTEVLSGTDFRIAGLAEISHVLKPGKNVLAIAATNEGNSPNPAGLIGMVRIRFGNRSEVAILSDDSWKVSREAAENWTQTDFEDSGWSSATVIHPFGQGPWGEVKTGYPRTDLPARYLKKEFAAEGKNVTRATAYIAGLGYYELYLNGSRIGDHVLDPVYKHYDVSVPYVTYHIEPKLLRQVNNIDVILGNGRYYAPRLHEPTHTKDYGFPKLLFQLVMEYDDGSSQTVVSDESWKVTADGPIRGNNDYDGEIYDARKEKLAGWQDVQVVDAPKGKLAAQNMPPMRVKDRLKPVAVTEPRPGVWVFDMGQNIVGWCRLKVRAPEGTEIQLKHAEVLQTEGADKGMLYLANIRGAKVRDIYICKGGSVETYEPRFTYHGFRYVEVTGLPGRPGIDTLTGCVVNTDLPFVGKFRCSNELINKIHKNIFWGVRGNYLHMPTDCPQRDERQGWQGDRAAESLGEMFLFDNVTLYSKWLQDIEESQTPEGNLSDVCPPYWPFYNRNVTWPSAFTIVPESILKQYGDDRPVKRHYAAMVKWLKYLERDIHGGIIEADNYGDWCVPPERKELIHSQDPARKTAKGILATSYYIHNLHLVAKYARILGKEDDVKAHEELAASMTEAFNKKYYDSETGKYDNGTQTSSVLPLYFGLVPDGEREKVFAALMNNIEHVTDYHIGTGLIGGQWINRVLTSFGRADVSYRFAANDDYPSWGYMVNKGATTIWELWNGDTANPAMNSHNHVMLIGDLAIWLYQNVAGIKSEDGFQTLEMAPVPVGDLTFVHAEYDSVRGPVKSSWQKASGKFIWQIAVPVGATAHLTVPTNDTESVKINGVKVQPDENGPFIVGSGKYTVTSSIK
jgi:alpha-L-rhamnosidase